MKGAKEKLSLEGVERLHAGLTEIARVARGNCEASISLVVSSRSSGSNQSFTGQERSSFTKPLLRGWGFSLEKVLTAIDTFDLEFLARSNVVFPTDFSREDDLSLSRNGGSHRR
jgi:hypothetical protein